MLVSCITYLILIVHLLWCGKDIIIITSSPDAASLQEQGCSELKLQATEVEVSEVKLRPELVTPDLITGIYLIRLTCSVTCVVGILKLSR